MVVQADGIIHRECNVPDAIPMLGQVRVNCSVIGIQWGLEDKEDVVLPGDVGTNVPVAGLQSSICDLRRGNWMNDEIPYGFESKTGAIEGGGLLGIPHPEHNMIESEVFAHLRFRSLVRVGCL